MSAHPGSEYGLIRLYDLDDVDDGYPLFDLRIRATYSRAGHWQAGSPMADPLPVETWPQLERIAGTTRHDQPGHVAGVPPLRLRLKKDTSARIGMGQTGKQ